MIIFFLKLSFVYSSGMTVEKSQLNVGVNGNGGGGRSVSLYRVTLHLRNGIAAALLQSPF